MAWFEDVFGHWVVKIIIATILIPVTAASGTRFLTINNDTRVFFTEENPELQARNEEEAGQILNKYFTGKFIVGRGQAD